MSLFIRVKRSADYEAHKIQRIEIFAATAIHGDRPVKIQYSRSFINLIKEMLRPLIELFIFYTFIKIRTSHDYNVITHIFDYLWNTKKN